MSRESKKPNLIYIFADQLRYSSLGYAGDLRAQTPNIDALCAKSTDGQRPSGVRAVPRLTVYGKIYDEYGDGDQ